MQQEDIYTSQQGDISLNNLNFDNIDTMMKDSIPQIFSRLSFDALQFIYYIGERPLDRLHAAQALETRGYRLIVDANRWVFPTPAHIRK
ncbi:MAG: hypothetical protein EZS28_015385 [Streblomastix strix]|uniref:NOT2/NOT3/NOT5 C-terminal domain-containing protein n=1 Tax=Streblomastix strix TaxID=222440 RepID=A0A5J4W3E3_9EUKA|nr:MAG: hypothetical protein EZS28_015385 [Streblomastix strix]